MTQIWLHKFLLEAVRRNFCTQIHCTTCGASEFRQGILDAWSADTGRDAPTRMDVSSATEICKALAKVGPIVNEAGRVEFAVRCLLFDIWCSLGEPEMERILVGSWAGTVFRRMQEHERMLRAARREREKFEGPEATRRRRELMKQEKQKAHQARLAAKEERDRAWRAKQGRSR